jgi:hypothetical protein
MANKRTSGKNVVITANRVEIDYFAKGRMDIVVTAQTTNEVYTYKAKPTLKQLQQCLKKLRDHANKRAPIKFRVHLLEPPLPKGYLVVAPKPSKPRKRKRANLESKVD